MDASTGFARKLLSTPIALSVGFGVLLILLALSGFNAMDVISRFRVEDREIVAEFLRTQTNLDELRSKIYLSGTYIRDYLLEPNPAKAEESRFELAHTRRDIHDLSAQAGETFEKHSDAEAQALYANLDRQVTEYWRVLDPALSWSKRQRHERGYVFLRDEVLPRRSAMLHIADTIASMNQQQLVQRDNRQVQMFTGVQKRLTAVITTMFVGGLLLAFIAALYILRLESQTMAHLRQVTAARQELRDLSARLVESQENERKSLSRELHDAVGQSMSAVQFELHDLGIVLSGYPEPLLERVSRIRELVESSVALVRNMALLLRPSMLDDLGLVPALEWHASRVSRSTGLSVLVIADSTPDDLPEEHKICVFRVVQEALNNVCKHARANAVEVTLRVSELFLSVTIHDNGRGLKNPPNRGLGLVGMEERAKILGGGLFLRSDSGMGTTVEVRLPLHQPGSVGCCHLARV